MGKKMGNTLSRLDERPAGVQGGLFQAAVVFPQKHARRLEGRGVEEAGRALRQRMV